MNEEIKEQAVVKELLDKSKDYSEAAKKFSTYFSNKYGSDFGGKISFDYDPVEEKMKMTCNEHQREFEADEISNIPECLQFLRKTASRKHSRIKK